MKTGGWGKVLDTVTFGPARRRRRMTKALEALDRLDARTDSSGVARPGTAFGSSPRDWLPPGRIRRDGRWWERHRTAGVVVAVAIVAAALWLPNNMSSLFPARAERPAGAAIPPRGVEASDQRLLPSVAGPMGEGGYAFMQLQPDGDGPVTFDPCRPIHYVIQLGSAPPDAETIVHEAAAELSSATGLLLVSDGLTDERPTEDRSPYQPDRYGDRWAPVLVAWSDPKETTQLAGEIAGIGGGHPWRDTRGRQTYVSGSVALDTPDLAELVSDARGRPHAKAVVMHEIAHVLGAGHVADERELMNEHNAGLSHFGPGDLRGLAILGQGACAPGL